MITLKLNKELYSYENLRYCCKDYSKLAKIEIECDLQYWVLNFWDCRYDETETIKEYENYLIEHTYRGLPK